MGLGASTWIDLLWTKPSESTLMAADVIPLSASSSSSAPKPISKVSKIERTPHWRCLLHRKRVHGRSGR